MWSVQTHNQGFVAPDKIRAGVSMNDLRRKEIRRALALVGEAKGILEVALTRLRLLPRISFSRCSHPVRRTLRNVGGLPSKTTIPTATAAGCMSATTRRRKKKARNSLRANHISAIGHSCHQTESR